jgi:hypothetical protein
MKEPKITPAEVAENHANARISFVSQRCTSCHIFFPGGRWRIPQYGVDLDFQTDDSSENSSKSTTDIRPIPFLKSEFQDDFSICLVVACAWGFWN